MMRAVRLHGVRDLRVDEMDRPGAPGPGEVALAVTAAGICGSDLHNYATGEWITRTPSVAGHELTGVVTATGDGVTHIREGQRAVVDSRVVCGSCRECLDGLPQVCANLGFVGEAIDGGFAEAVILPAGNVLPAPDGVPDRHLAMAEPLAVALHALACLNAPAGAPIVIAGCGAIGTLTALAAARRGHSLSLLDRDTGRRDRLAGIVGAEILTFDAEWDLPPRHGVDTTGAPAVVSGLLDRLAPGGAIALVGIGSGTMSLDPARLVEAETAVRGCHAFADELPHAAEALGELGPDLDRLLGEPIALGDIPAAYARHLEGRVAAFKTVIDLSL